MRSVSSRWWVTRWAPRGAAADAVSTYLCSSPAAPSAKPDVEPALRRGERAAFRGCDGRRLGRGKELRRTLRNGRLCVREDRPSRGSSVRSMVTQGEFSGEGTSLEGSAWGLQTQSVAFRSRLAILWGGGVVPSCKRRERVQSLSARRKTDVFEGNQRWRHCNQGKYLICWQLLA